MLEKSLVIAARHGLHARTAGRLAAAVRDLAADVELVRGEAVADAASILDVLALGCGEGSPVTIRARGLEAVAALAAVAALLTGRPPSDQAGAAPCDHPHDCRQEEE